jgi:hypothetical protein
VQQGAQVLGNGTQLSAEEVNPQGTVNTIINDGLSKSAHGAADLVSEHLGQQRRRQQHQGVTQTDVVGDNVLRASGNSQVDFTHRGKVAGNLIFAGDDDTLHVYMGWSVSGSVNGSSGANIITFNPRAAHEDL